MNDEVTHDSYISSNTLPVTTLNNVNSNSPNVNETSGLISKSEEAIFLFVI